MIAALWIVSLVAMFLVGFYYGVSYGTPAWLDFAAEQAKKRKEANQ